MTVHPIRGLRIHTVTGDLAWSDGRHLHRTDGPALERADGTREWWVHGRLHRADGPAVITAAGDRVFYLHGRVHRADGPARVLANGDREWFRHGYRHRLDGPAVEQASGRLELWVDGRVAHTAAGFRILRERFLGTVRGHHACDPGHPCHGVPVPARRTIPALRPSRANTVEAA